MKFILASASPRRSDILKEYGFDFDVIPSNEKEVVDCNLSAEKVVESLALQKAQAVYIANKRLTLGADTVVVLDGEILGKPKSVNHSIELLNRLSGRAHLVITGYALIDKDRQIVSHDITKVYFNELTEEQIAEYVSSGLGMDKAGGYGIQDNFGLVKKVEGSYYNVVGLPIEKIAPLLRS